MSELTVSQVMTQMPDHFNAEKARGVNTVIQFHITGEQAGDWIVSIQDGGCTVEEGVATHPSLTMTVDSQDYLDIVSGKLSGMQAAMTGKLRLGGDMTLAMRFEGLFDQ